MCFASLHPYMEVFLYILLAFAFPTLLMLAGLLLAEIFFTLVGHWRYTILLLAIFGLLSLYPKFYVSPDIVLVVSFSVLVLSTYSLAYCRAEEDCFCFGYAGVLKYEHIEKCRKYLLPISIGLIVLSSSIGSAYYAYNMHRARLINRLQDYMYIRGNDNRVEQCYDFIRRETVPVRISVVARWKYNNSVGNSWITGSSVNGIMMQNGAVELPFTYGDTLRFFSESMEIDRWNDYGSSRTISVPSKNDILKGYKLTDDVYVVENRGRYAGNCAHWEFTYTIKAISPEPLQKTSIIVPQDSIDKYWWTFGKIPYFQCYDLYYDPISSYKEEPSPEIKLLIDSLERSLRGNTGIYKMVN